MGAWVAWVELLRGLRKLRGSKYFLRGHNFYVGCVGKKLLRGSIFFTRVKIFCLSQNFLRGRRFLHGSFFWVGEKGVGNGSKKYLD